MYGPGNLHALPTPCRYGQSEGSPSEQGLQTDSQVIRHLISTTGGALTNSSQTVLDFVRADPVLSSTRVVRIYISSSVPFAYMLAMN